MTAHAATRTGGADGPGLTGRKPDRQLRTVLSLAGAEAGLLVRSVLVLAGLVVGGLAVWRFTWPTEPLWWNAAWLIGYGQVILAAAVLVTAQLATGRARRDGLRELYDSFPVSAATRSLAHVVALAGALPASLLLIGGAAAWIEFRGAIGTPSAAVLAGGVLLVIAAGAAGVALGARFPHPLAGILGAVVLLALFTQSSRWGALPWLFPWTTPDQLGTLPGPLAGYPPGGAHAVELAGIAVLAAAAALAAGRARHRMSLAATALLAVAAICVSGAVQLRPIPTATLNRLVSEVADPPSAQHCTTASQVRYCLYPRFGPLLPAFQAPVSGVLSVLPARAQVLTIAQDVSLSLDDPPLTHGHAKQQLARWNTELQAAPTSAATPSAIYVMVGQWPAARFALALRTAEWAVNLPPGSPGSSGTACVPVDQAREAIAIWLAITATHASTGELQSGQNLNGRTPGTSSVVLIVHSTPVIAWTSPAESFNYISSPGPQTTAAGYLLAKAMTGLPEGKVKRVLDAAWPTWLNWHTTDTQLAATLGIPMPSVRMPPGAPGGGPGPQPVQSPVCTS